MELLEQMKLVIANHGLATSETPVLLMVSGGSDSTALAYLASQLSAQGAIGPLAMLHVNHKLRGADADADAEFTAQLAALLGIPLFSCDIQVARIAQESGENIEAVARRERYLAADEALNSLCYHCEKPRGAGRIFTAHTADDRMESFYMRSIVGTGPGGFRSMRYSNGPVMRPLLDATREELQDYLRTREEEGLPVARNKEGNLWCEDATNAHTDRFRAYVRHNILPVAKQWNQNLGQTLVRTMNLIADEDDMLEDLAEDLVKDSVEWLVDSPVFGTDYGSGCLLKPEFGRAPLPLQSRAVFQLLRLILPRDARVENASVQAVLDLWEERVGSEAAQAVDSDQRDESARRRASYRVPKSGGVANIQGDLAVSSNKQGVRIEPMVAFRARRKRGSVQEKGE